MNYFGLETYHCPLSLEKEVKEYLVQGLTYVARNAFGTAITIKDVRNHVIPVSTLITAKNMEKFIGFSTYNTYHFGNSAVIYGAGACVLRSKQTKGLYTRFNEIGIETELRKNKADEFYFSARTQNPVVYASISKIENLEELYPNEKKAPNDVFNVGRKMSHILGGKINKNFVMKNAYSGCLNDKIQRYKIEKVNKMFDSLLNYEKGDALLMAAKIK